MDDKAVKLKSSYVAINQLRNLTGPIASREQIPTFGLLRSLSFTVYAGTVICNPGSPVIIIQFSVAPKQEYDFICPDFFSICSPIVRGGGEGYEKKHFQRFPVSYSIRLLKKYYS